jgi:DNA-binding NtrC family response regulator
MAQELVTGTERIQGLKERVAAYERRLIQEALWMAGGNQRRAAAALGCLPTTLNEKMRRLGLRRPTPAQRPEPLSTGPFAMDPEGFPPRH